MDLQKPATTQEFIKQLQQENQILRDKVIRLERRLQMIRYNDDVLEDIDKMHEQLRKMSLTKLKAEGK